MLYSSLYYRIGNILRVQTLSSPLLLYCVILVFISCTTYVNATEYKKNIEQKAEYIIEFKSSQDTSSFLRRNTHNIKIVRNIYSSKVLYGTAVEFNDAHTAEYIIGHEDEGIMQAWPVHHRIQQQAPVGPNAKKLLESNEDSNTTPFTPQNKDTIKLLTEVYNIQSLESKGSGIKIGIIDSGVDYTHQALGGCFGEGCKVAYGYDLVGDNFNGSLDSIQESDDPIDNCPVSSTSATGHGTFISGIIAADDKVYNWTGVAPEVKIGMWRVYGCNYANSPNDIILKAMEMAYMANMDIISLSLGISGGWEEDVLSVFADRLVSKGIHVIVASGNIGTSGIFLTASPATGKNVIAVGSTQNNHVPGYIFKAYYSTSAHNRTSRDLATGGIEIPYRTDNNSPLAVPALLNIIPANNKFNPENDACDGLTKRGYHSSGKFDNSIVLIHQGGCSPIVKINHARVAGAKAVLIYTTVANATTSFDAVTNASLPIAFINNDDGKILFDLSSERESSVKGQFTNILTALNAPAADIDSISGYTSLGPTNELDLKPEIVAVGGNVFSTLPRYMNMYGFRSGTSMSTPFISASVALFLSNLSSDKKKATPNVVKNVLMNFATPVKSPISDLQYGDSPIRQGAGMIDVVQAVKGYEQFHVEPAKLSLNDTQHFMNGKKKESFKLYNDYDTELTFHIKHVPSLTVTGYNNGSFTPVEPIGLYSRNASAATLSFSKEVVTLAAGSSVEIMISVAPPTEVFDQKSHALYGGFIRVTSSSNLTAQVPYIGMIGNMKELPIFQKSVTSANSVAPYGFPSIGLNNGITTLNPSETGHFNISSSMGTGGPYILARLLTGTPIIHIQILKGDSKIVVGDVPIDTTRLYLMRNTLTQTEYSSEFYSWYWSGQYVPAGTTLEGINGLEKARFLDSGEYYLKLRGLKVFGNRESNSLNDWDEWVSPKLILNINK